MRRSRGGGGFDPQKTNTERTCSVLRGHRDCIAGGVEGVHRLVSICGLSWWEAGMQRSRGGRGFDPQGTNTGRTHSVSPGHWNCIAGSVEGVHRLVLICGLMLWEARMRRSRGGGGFDPQKTDTERTRSISPGHRNCIVGGVEGVCRLVLICGLR